MSLLGEGAVGGNTSPEKSSKAVSHPLPSLLHLCFLDAFETSTSVLPHTSSMGFCCTSGPGKVGAIN